MQKLSGELVTLFLKQPECEGSISPRDKKYLNKMHDPTKCKT